MQLIIIVKVVFEIQNSLQEKSVLDEGWNKISNGCWV